MHVDSDILPDSGVMPTTFEGVYKFLKKVPERISKGDGGNGKPVAYALLPLQLLAFLQGKNIAAANTPLIQLSADTLERFVTLFANFSGMQLALSDYLKRISQHPHCIPEEHIKEIEDRKRIVNGREAALQSRFAMTLKDARAGKERPESLWELSKEFMDDNMPLDTVLGALGKYTDKMDFFDMVIKKGAEYVGFSGHGSLEAGVHQLHIHHEIYVFRFNWESQYGYPVLHENIAMLLELLGEDGTTRKAHIIVRDCDGVGDTVDRPHISHERDMTIITEDLVEERKERADKSFMQYDMVGFEQGPHKRPIKMAKVTLTCPSKTCSDTLLRDWICYKCHTSISFGYSDTFLYCDCGRGLYSNWTFQCNDPEHGEGWSKYEAKTLLESLTALEPLEALNILILGETGVGKSTFINAFVNYLTYDTLDDAMKAKKFQCIIPFSFATQVVDKTMPRHPFVTRTVCGPIYIILQINLTLVLITDCAGERWSQQE